MKHIARLIWCNLNDSCARKEKDSEIDRHEETKGDKKMVLVTIKKDVATKLVGLLPCDGETVAKAVKKGQVFIGVKKRGAVKQYTLSGARRHVNSVLSRHA